MKAYPNYKDVRFDWFGKIPSHWTMTTVRYFYDVKLGKMLDSNKQNEDHFIKPYVRAANIHWNRILLDEVGVNEMGFSEPQLERYVLRPGDLLVTEGGVTVGRSAIWKGELMECYYQNSLNRARALKGTSTTWLYYWMYFVTNNGFIDILADKSTFGHLTNEKLKALPIPVPPLSEQQTIADFLDCKTSQVDALIEKKQQQIDLLREQHVALINHTVTRGMNPGTLMKDSGLEWLGQIPSHWETPKLKWLAQTTSGATPNSGDRTRYYDNGSIPWVRTLDLNNGEVYQTEFKITELALQETACNVLPENSVLIAMYGGGGTIGKNGILKIKAATNQAVCAVLPSAYLDSSFLFYYVNFYRPFWMIDAVGTRKDPNISQEIIRNLTVALPPMHEQKAIAKFLLDEKYIYDAAIKKNVQTIHLLEEYRTALISEAVTGKIDVREWKTVHE